jgi:hypothetical protein
MTTAQEEVLELVSELLREHFEGYLLSVVDELDEGKMALVQYHVGLLQAIGLAKASEQKLLEYNAEGIAFWNQEEEEE